MTLSTIKTIPSEFNNTAAALEYANSRGSQHHLLRTDNLILAQEGLLTHHGGAQTAFCGLPVTDVALAQLNSLLGIPISYARRIDSTLHAYAVNRHLHNLDGSVTVVVEFDKADPDNKQIAAILPGACLGIDHVVILQQLESAGVKTQVRFTSGAMEVEFGTPNLVEVLSEDYVQLTGHFCNIRWGSKASTRPSLEASVLWKRLICSNGAYLQRALATGRLMQLASRQQAAQFVGKQISRLQGFEKTVLLPAVEQMNQSNPQEEEHERVERLISRLAGTETAQELLSSAVTWWDEFNAVTAAANRGVSQNNARKLQIEGGAMLERFLRS